MKQALLRIVLTILVFHLLVVGVIVIRAFMKPPIDSEIRAKGSGSYTLLSRGMVHYEHNVVNPNGPTAVMIHGITVPMIVWNKTVPALNEAGINTLRMDLYGRGYSDRPKAKYGAELYIQQVAELLDSLSITEPIDIIGISMGGAIAANVSHTFPERIRTVTLIDPAVSYRSEEGPEYTWKRLGRGLKGIFNLRKKEVQEERKHLDEFKPHIREQFRYRGIEFTLLSMALYGKSENFIFAYRKLSKTDLPIQIIWGEKDHVLPLTLGKRLAAEFDSVPFHVIPEEGHTPQYENPTLVNPILVNFILSEKAR